MRDRGDPFQPAYRPQSATPLSEWFHAYARCWLPQPYGTSFWLQGRFVLPVLGPVTMLWLAYLVGLMVLVMIVLRIDNGLENSTTEKLPDIDERQPDEPGRVFVICLGCSGWVGFGGDRDQHLVRRYRCDSGVCVF